MLKQLRGNRIMAEYYKVKAFKYRQHKQEFLSLVLPFRVINEISRVLIYGEDKYGYQRKLDRKHYNKIKKDLIARQAILPTSIILSVDNNYIIEKMDEIDSDLLELTLDSGDKAFRIVDGQHRIEGLKLAMEDEPEFKEFFLNVIILVTEPENRVREVEVFEDINSKAKKIKTDLTILAKYNYVLLGEKQVDDLSEHISIKAAYSLNETIPGSVWHNAIQFDFNTQEKMEGIIGVSAFINSIIPITKEYIRKEPVSDVGDKEKLIAYTNAKSEILASFLNDAWGIVKKKWPQCFNNTIQKNLFNYTEVQYSKGHYIQKTAGTNAIHMIFYECMSENNGLNEEVINLFKRKVFDSTIKSREWEIGGIFSGLTSKSGFKNVKNYILNKETL